MKIPWKKFLKNLDVPKNLSSFSRFLCLALQLKTWVFFKNPHVGRSFEIHSNGNRSFVQIDADPEFEEKIEQKISKFKKEDSSRIFFFDANFSTYPSFWVYQILPYLFKKISSQIPIEIQGSSLIYNLRPQDNFEKTFISLQDLVSQILSISYQSSIVRIWNLIHPERWGLQRIDENFYSPTFVHPLLKNQMIPFYNDLDNSAGRLSLRIFLNPRIKHRIAEYLLLQKKFSFFFSSHLENHEGELYLDFIPIFDTFLEKEDFPTLISNLIEKIFEISTLVFGEIEIHRFSSFEQAEEFGLQRNSPTGLIYQSENFHPFVYSNLQTNLHDLRKKSPFSCQVPREKGQSILQLTDEIRAFESQMTFYLQRSGISSPKLRRIFEKDRIRIEGPYSFLNPRDLTWNSKLYFLGSGILAQYIGSKFDCFLSENLVSCNSNELQKIENFQTFYNQALQNKNLVPLSKENDGRNLLPEIFLTFGIRILYSTANEYLLLLENPNLSSKWILESVRRIKRNLLPLWRFSSFFEKEENEMRVFLHLCYQELCEDYPFLVDALDQIFILPDTTFLIPVISKKCAEDFEKILFLNRKRKIFLRKCIQKTIQEYFVHGIYFYKDSISGEGFCGSFEENLPQHPFREILVDSPLPFSTFEFLPTEDAIAVQLVLPERKIFIGFFEKKSFQRIQNEISLRWRRGLLQSLWGKNFHHHFGEISSFPIYL